MCCELWDEWDAQTFFFCQDGTLRFPSLLNYRHLPPNVHLEIEPQGRKKTIDVPECVGNALLVACLTCFWCFQFVLLSIVSGVAGRFLRNTSSSNIFCSSSILCSLVRSRVS